MSSDLSGTLNMLQDPQAHSIAHARTKLPTIPTGVLRVLLHRNGLIDLEAFLQYNVYRPFTIAAA